MKKGYLVAIFLVVLLVLGAAGIARYFLSAQKKLPENINSSNGRLEMTLVDAATIYPGRVVEVMVSEGDEVVKGQPLVRMQDSEAQSQLNIANAAKQRGIEAKQRAKAEYAAHEQKLNVSRLEYHNALSLRKDKLISASEVEKRKAQFLADKASLRAVAASIKEAEAAIGEGQANIDRVQTIKGDLIIKSPIDGRVENQVVEVGSVIPQGAKVMTIVDYKNAYMNIYLTTASTTNIRLGDEARIVLDHLEAVFPAVVQYVSSEAQFTPKYVETASEREKMMYRVKLKLPQEVAIHYNKLLKSGLTGNGYVRTKQETSWPDFLKVRLPRN
ncbi:MAG: HlyD family efflux transporter periplasmic adaptor subunit [Neisseriaceae bacterium]